MAREAGADEVLSLRNTSTMMILHLQLTSNIPGCRCRETHVNTKGVNELHSLVLAIKQITYVPVDKSRTGFLVPDHADFLVPRMTKYTLWL